MAISISETSSFHFLLPLAGWLASASSSSTFPLPELAQQQQQQRLEHHVKIAFDVLSSTYAESCAWLPRNNQRPLLLFFFFFFFLNQNSYMNETRIIIIPPERELVCLHGLSLCWAKSIRKKRRKDIQGWKSQLSYDFFFFLHSCCRGMCVLLFLYQKR